MAWTNGWQTAAYGASTASRPCLNRIIPAEAFYEPDWRSGKAVPTRITRADRQPMGIAGIWMGWKAPDAAGGGTGGHSGPSC
ncbi:SOS response-associated peptidase family protein [Malikia spinosa]|uniref:SOS response-associated peptidase family protein n=1 Tax=Malikia spinosa TaxID=86180 RepID=UPI0019286CAD